MQTSSRVHSTPLLTDLLDKLTKWSEGGGTAAAAAVFMFCLYLLLATALLYHLQSADLVSDINYQLIAYYMFTIKVAPGCHWSSNVQFRL